jgi:hypothetical protein
VLSNASTAAATFTNVHVEILNPSACESIAPQGLGDISSVNPGKSLYNGQWDKPILRGINQVMGSLSVTMKRNLRPRRLLILRVSIVSVNMRGRVWEFRIHLGATGFTVRKAHDRFLY